MKKIRILTFWGVPNYGAFAQAYALNMLVKKLMPDADVKHLAYLHPKHYDLYHKKKKPTLCSMQQFISPGFYKEVVAYFGNKKVEYPAFDTDWNSIPHTTLKNENELESSWSEIIITGSDAIWEYSISDFGDDMHLIGNNLNCDRLISYAASFGDMNVGDVFPDFVANGLRKYDMISVRDDVSKDIIRDLAGDLDVSVVLDPTLLHDFKNDCEIPRTKYSNYILVYGSEFPEKLISEVQDYARENQLTIIGAGIAPGWCDICLNRIGPKEWIGLFRDAAFVVTCTFHGLMFSINYEKKVVFNQVAYVKNRSTYLLEKLGIYDLFENGVTLKEVMRYDWNYSVINDKLNDMREVSYQFLERGLRYE